MMSLFLATPCEIIIWYDNKQTGRQYINTYAALESVCCLVRTQNRKTLCYVASVFIRQNVYELLEIQRFGCPCESAVLVNIIFGEMQLFIRLNCCMVN